jgi:hypothetical protein
VYFFVRSILVVSEVWCIFCRTFVCSHIHYRSHVLSSSRGAFGLALLACAHVSSRRVHSSNAVVLRRRYVLMHVDLGLDRALSVHLPGGLLLRPPPDKLPGFVDGQPPAFPGPCPYPAPPWPPPPAPSPLPPPPPPPPPPLLPPPPPPPFPPGMMRSWLLVSVCVRRGVHAGCSRLGKVSDGIALQGEKPTLHCQTVVAFELGR